MFDPPYLELLPWQHQLTQMNLKVNVKHAQIPDVKSLQVSIQPFSCSVDQHHNHSNTTSRNFSNVNNVNTSNNGCNNFLEDTKSIASTLKDIVETQRQFTTLPPTQMQGYQDHQFIPLTNQG